MPHLYDTLATHLLSAFEELSRLHLPMDLSKGRVGEILLARELGHSLVVGSTGADGRDANGKLYEYKVSVDDQYNFLIGPRQPSRRPADQVTEKFSAYEGAYLALFDGKRFTMITYCPMSSLLPVLVGHVEEQSVDSNQLQKNFGSMRSFRRNLGRIAITIL